MNRRHFLGLLAALPFVRHLRLPEPAPPPSRGEWDNLLRAAYSDVAHLAPFTIDSSGPFAVRCNGRVRGRGRQWKVRLS